MYVYCRQGHYPHPNKNYIYECKFSACYFIKSDTQLCRFSGICGKHYKVATFFLS